MEADPVLPHVLTVALSFALVGLFFRNYLETLFSRWSTEGEISGGDEGEEALRHLAETLFLFRGQIVFLESEDIPYYSRLIAESKISIEALQAAVHAGLIRYGKQLYAFLVSGGYTYPDQVASPQALGYALVHGHFSREEIKKIHFSSGETIERYVRYAEDLLESVVKQISSGSGGVLPDHDKHPIGGSDACVDMNMPKGG